MRKNIFIANILATIILIVGTSVSFGVVTKIANTYGNLILLNCEARLYNSQSRKTDKMTSTAIEAFEERNEIYASTDPIVSFVSNQKSPVKLIILAGVIAYYLLIAYMWYFLIIGKVKMIQKRLKKQRRRNYNTRNKRALY